MSGKKRYDYLRETSADLADLDVKLANHGKAGWELVSVVFDGTRFIAFLKRKTKYASRHEQQ
jgi:hypothetical protein